MKRSYKILLWIFGILLGLFLLLLLIVSPVARYVIEKNGEAWIGRKVEVEKTGINLLNGRINIRELKVFESTTDTVFFRVDQLLVDINLWKLLQGTYHIEQLHIGNPAIRFIQRGDSLNFSDFASRFPVDTTASLTDTLKPKAVNYVVEDVTISGGSIHYVNHDFGADIRVEELALEVPAVSWDNPDLDLMYSLSLASGGDVAGNFHLNQESLDYSLQVEVDSLNIGFILPYLTPYLKVKQMDGTCLLSMATRGNIHDPYRSAMRGKVDIQHFGLMGSEEKKEIAFDHLAVSFDSINTWKGFVNLGDIKLAGLYLREERYDSADSFSRLITRNFDGYTPDGRAPDSAFIIASRSNPVILLMDYIKEMQKVVVIDSFSVNELHVTNGTMDFIDHTLLKPADLHVEKLALMIRDINSSNCNATGTFHTTVETTGQIDIEFTFCPFKPYDFEATYQLKNIKVVHYNQYSIFYTDYPFKEGTLYYNGSVSLKNQQLKMDNNLFLKKIYLGKKVENKVGMHLPMKLILAIIRDKEGNVFLELPITGDLKDPKVNYWNLIGQALKNFFRKIFSSPSRQLAKEYGEDEQFFKDICFVEDQTALSGRQKHQLDKLAQVLTEKPQLVLDFQQPVCHDINYSTPSDSLQERTEKRNLLVKNYLSPYLNDPGNRIKFSIIKESTQKGNADSPCYHLVYSVMK